MEKKFKKPFVGRNTNSLSKVNEGQTPSIAVLVGVFFLSSATLLSEILWTRIFSAAIWYHFAFLIVSIAMLGFGFSGVLLRVFPNVRLWDHENRCPLLAFVFSAGLLLAFFVTNLVPFSPFSLFKEPQQIAILFLYYIVLSLPFLCAGLIIGLLLTKQHQHAGIYYCADLLGAGVGVIIFFFLIGPLGAQGTLAVTTLLGFAAANLLPHANPRGKRIRIAAIAGILLSIILIFFPTLLPQVRIDVSKAMSISMEEGQNRIIFTKWNPLSRIDVIDGSSGGRSIMIDAGASTPLTAGKYGQPENEKLRANATAGVFSVVKSNPSVLIIGSGGGLDVRIALTCGASSITAIEINPTIVDITRNLYRDYLGGLYQDQRVEYIEAEGRNYIRQSQRKYDVIQLTLIDTWAASTSGAYSLSENYLYTVEAIHDYYARLNPEGVLSITRWNFEMPRLLSLVRSAIPMAQNQTMVVENYPRSPRSTLLLKKGIYKSKDFNAISSFCKLSNSLIAYSPSLPQKANPLYQQILRSKDLERVNAYLPINITAVSDDRPFFFQQAKLKNLDLRSIALGRKMTTLQPTAVPAGEIALLAVFFLSTFLSVLFLIIPLWIHKEGKISLRKDWKALAYFSGLGIGFIIFEIGAMQRFNLFLGHPFYSITVVLFSMLIASGLGSLAASRWTSPKKREFKIIGLCITISIFLHFIISSFAFSMDQSISFVLRIMLSILLITPVAFFMGMALPSAVRAMGARNKKLIPWGWGMNGATSVVGSSLAILVAMILGFKAVISGTMIVYALTFTVFISWLDIYDAPRHKRRHRR